MGIKSWKAEFYPTTAKQAARKSMIAAIEHSLRKWEGLSQKQLKKHGLVREYAMLIDVNRVVLDIDNSTCALCEKYMDYDPNYGLFDDTDNVSPSECAECPIVLSGQRSCNKPNSVYTQYISDSENSGAAMVKVLKKALKWAQRQQKKEA